MTRQECNSWFNYETWRANLYFGELFHELAHDYFTSLPSDELPGAEAYEFDQLVDHCSECFECSIDELMPSVPDGSFAQQILNSALAEINWQEIAEFYIKQLVSDFESDMASDSAVEGGAL